MLEALRRGEFGSCLGPVKADDRGDPDFLSGLCGTADSASMSGVAADAGGGGAMKSIG